MERAFLSALRVHFPKPGPWQLTIHTAANPFVVLHGQVFEVYIAVVAGDYVRLWRLGKSTGYRLGFNSGTVSAVFPAFMLRSSEMTNIDPVTGDVTGIAVTGFCTLPQGYILTEGMSVGLMGTSEWDILWRRRFDLE